MLARLEAAWVALRGPDFNARDCDLSTANLGQHLNPQERAFLADPLESAKQELVLPRLPDAVEGVVMAVRELRVP